MRRQSVSARWQAACGVACRVLACVALVWLPRHAVAVTDALDMLCFVGLAGVASQGGVAYIDGGSFTATNCDFSSNSAVRDLLASLCRVLAWVALVWLSRHAVAVTDTLDLL